MDFKNILQTAISHKASDIHLRAENTALLRINGALKEVDNAVLSGEDIDTALRALMSDAQQKTFETNGEVDFSATQDGASRFRVSAFRTRGGIAAAIRIIPLEVPSIAALGLPEPAEEFIASDNGIVLVTGGAGAGKSTTLAAMLGHINASRAVHILTIENPVEFIHAPQKSLINHRELGGDSPTYEGALKKALREDPDVVMVGDIETYEALSLALYAAESGCLVLSSLNAAVPILAIQRLVDFAPLDEKEIIRDRLARMFGGIVAQNLVGEGDARKAAFETLEGTNYAKQLIRENKVNGLESLIKQHSAVEDEAETPEEKAGEDESGEG